MKIVLDRRNAMKGMGALAAGLATGIAGRSAAIAAPAVARGTVLTVSVWGGITEDGIKKHVQPEFERATGAKLAYDIGGMGARYNKLLAQRANPPADVFFSTDEALVAGRKANILTDATKKNMPNLADVATWAQTVKATSSDTVPGAPYTVLGYILGYDPKSVKEPVTSWADMWRPEFAGKLAFAAPVHSIMPALVIIAAELNGGSATNVDPGFKKLAELRPAKLTVFWTDWAPLNKSGDAVIGTDFDYYLESMKDQKYPIEPVFPKEKGLAAAQYTSVVKGTKNQELAEEFMNQMMAVKAQEAFAVESFQGAINTKVQLPANVQARCSCGPKVDQLRFFDPEFAASVRASWTERLNTEVVPSWRTR
jgi:putative spermidine/putrescine transport system substrate-binding protein